MIFWSFWFQKQEEPEESSSEEEDVIEPESTLFVKNLNFETTEEGLKEVGLEKCRLTHYGLVTQCGNIEL